MTRTFALIAATALSLSAGGASAETGVASAIAAATVGEQADGYLGVRGAVPSVIKSEVEAINIKRRAAYTDLAAKRGVTVKDVAATVGCQTLATRVGTGQAYQLRDGVWRVREGSAAIALPEYCAS